MAQTLPAPNRLPCTADHYQWRGKPAAVIPGRWGVVYEPAPRKVSWTMLVQQGKRISSQQFRVLLYEQD